MNATMKKDYVISIYGPPGNCWYVEPGDEDDDAQLITTSDPTAASRFTDFVEARDRLRLLEKQYTTNSFRLDVIPPILGGAACPAPANFNSMRG